MDGAITICSQSSFGGIKISNKLNFWNVNGIINTLGLLQSKREAH